MLSNLIMIPIPILIPKLLMNFLNNSDGSDDNDDDNKVWTHKPISHGNIRSRTESEQTSKHENPNIDSINGPNGNPKENESEAEKL